jgi:hypothetical protein
MKQIDAMLAELKKNGAKIIGNNPWEIDTRQSGVKLRGSWSECTATLSVTLTGKDWYVPSSMIWDTIESLMHQSGRLPETAKPVEDGVQA